MGAAGLIVSGSMCYECGKFTVPPRVTLPADTGGSPGQVSGIDVDIPVLSIAVKEMEVEWKTAILGPSQVYKANVTTTWEVATSFTADENPYDAILSWFGVYHICVLVIGCYAALLGLFIVKSSVDVVAVFSESKKKHSLSSRMALAVRLCILIPEFIGAIAAVMMAIDPLGVFHVFDYFTARRIFNFRGSVVAITDVVMICYCYDIYKNYQKSRKFRRNTPFLVKHKWGLPMIFLIGIVMLVVDQVTVDQSLTGRAGSNGVILPTLYLIVLYLTTTGILFVLSHKVQQEMNKISAKAVEEPAMLEIVNRSALLRKYMLISAWTKLFGVFGLILVATGVVFTSPLVYALTVSFTLCGMSLACSTVQVLIVVEITPRDTEKETAPSTVGILSKESAVTPLVFARRGVASSSPGPIKMGVVSRGTKKGTRVGRTSKEMIVAPSTAAATDAPTSSRKKEQVRGVAASSAPSSSSPGPRKMVVSRGTRVGSEEMLVVPPTAATTDTPTLLAAARSNK